MLLNAIWVPSGENDGLKLDDCAFDVSLLGSVPLAFMEKIAPLTNAAKIKRPLFVIQGKNDPRVPLIEAEQMVATLQKHDTPVWYLMAKDEGHGFAKKRNADFQFYATVMFMREFLVK